MSRLIILLITAAAGLCRAQEGTAVFLRSCVRCHAPNSDARAPRPEEMGKMPWQDILKTLESGSMKAQGAALSADDRRAVARYLGASGPAVLPEMSGFCATGARPAKTAMAWNGWGVDDWNTRFQPAAAAAWARKRFLTETEVGLWHAERHVRIFPADCVWRAGIHRQQRRHNLRARCAVGVHLLAVSGESPGPRGCRDRPGLAAAISTTIASRSNRERTRTGCRVRNCVIIPATGRLPA